MEDLRFKRAEREDIKSVFTFIKELAEYEKMSDEVVATEKTLEEWIFDKNAAKAFLISVGEEEIGFILYFYNFSTFVGRTGIHLEDLYIRPQYRGNGYGKKAVEFLAKTAVEEGCERVEWSCLDWNKPSIDFYISLGAKPMSEWTVYRLSGDELKKYGE